MTEARTSCKPTIDPVIRGSARGERLPGRSEVSETEPGTLRLTPRTVQVGIEVEILGELGEILGFLFFAQSFKLVVKD